MGYDYPMMNDYGWGWGVGMMVLWFVILALVSPKNLCFNK
jgi:uncharacterized membrane protein